ncbi:hypothetical protein ES705_36597 [subsurface metagenome]
MSNEYGYGREQIVYAKAETADAFGTLVQPSAADAMKVLSCNMNVSQERKDRLEKGSSRSIINRFSGRKSADWSIEKYVLPSGARGTKPDDAILWEALFGTEEVHMDASVDYLLSAEPSISLSIFSIVGPHYEAICGAVPSKWGLKFGGGDEPKVTFSGEAKDHYLCSSGKLAEAASETTAITVNDARQFAIGMLIKVGTEDNSGAGFKIADINYTINLLTLDAQVSDQAVDAAVIPLPLSATTTGDVIPVIVGNVKIGTPTILITGCSFDVDQKVALRNDEFGSESASGFRHPEFRDVTCSLDMYFKKDAAKWLNDAKRFTAQDIEVNLGTTEGYKMEIDANQVEFEIPTIDVPDTGECTITLSGKCLGSSGEDELKVCFL